MYFGLTCKQWIVASAMLLGASASFAQGTGYWHTSGNRILDADGAQVRIAGVNWYGFETTNAVVGGLNAQDYKTILQTIKNNGYNTIRLPFSSQMVEAPSTNLNITYANGRNAELQGLNSLQVMDKIVAYAGTVGLKIILDNHRSTAGGGPQENGLWYSGNYTEASWINDWTMLANRYLVNPTVIGFDLRNEPHNATSGGACWDCGGANDWHLAAARAGNAVLSVNPKLLIFVEGVDAYHNDYYWWGGNLEGVRNSPVTLSTTNQLVYSPHDYGPSVYGQPWFNGSTTYSSLSAVWTNHWAFIDQGNIAPVWVGEFGTGNNNLDAQNTAAGSEGQWFQSLIEYIQATPTLNWTYWALNGEDSLSLLNGNYDAIPANAVKQSLLAGVQYPLKLGGGAISSPAAPGVLTASAASASQINLSWTASATSGVTYTVYGRTSAGSATMLASGLSGTNYAATGLAGSTAYYFTVKAVSGSAYSAASNQASATTQAASTSACHIAYLNQNDWGTGFTGNISITNNSSTPLTSWVLTWSYAGNQQLNQSWNGSYMQTGHTVTIVNANWNNAIAAGSTLTGIGFNAGYSGTNANPVAFYLNGVQCH